MRKQLRKISVVILFFSTVPAQPAAPAPLSAGRLTGRWRVTFSLTGDPEKHLIFEVKPKGAGAFTLLDPGPDEKAIPNSAPAVWSEVDEDRVSFSGETELQIGTCCRQQGTLIFKGKFKSNSTISGGLIFVTSIDEEESPYKYRSHVGTFTATLLN